jgi:hypothetical protein
MSCSLERIYLSDSPTRLSYDIRLDGEIEHSSYDMCNECVFMNLDSSMKLFSEVNTMYRNDLT